MGTLPPDGALTVSRSPAIQPATWPELTDREQNWVPAPRTVKGVRNRL